MAKTLINRKNYKIALAIKGWTQGKLAKRLGVDPSSMSRWAKNWYELPLTHRVRLSHLLNINYKDLFTREKR